ncbi:MAG: ATP-grasp domain-containing protein, partial [Dehalococcoidia bacterium]|nr:ATP-grasp domain-containing protein [Dehalococcoidia bacterium]
RGEIAVRVIEALRTLGIRSVVIASIPDRHSRPVRLADDWVLLEGYSAAETYLDVEAVIAAAKSTGCEAIHPGYGFLSERADFAEACADAGLAFVGPPADVLRALGDKAGARQIALAHGVPVVPGYDGPDDHASLLRAGERLGFPLMVKARGGGGGRGMREVHGLADLPEALAAARREAEAAFGDPGLLLERLVTHAHHVEVQVLGDSHGNLIHLGERDCSVQRRRQKLIEESPSPVIDDGLRSALTGAALRLARAVNYVNAGTVEFLVGEPGEDGQRPFYFLEVNPRLQVEHPVTELVTGLDLVGLQLRVAAGEPLPFAQEDVRFEGHAVEFRINAEDPWESFRPSAGRIHGLSLPPAWAARTDMGYGEGDTVPAQYDSLLAKVVVHEADRAAALDAGIEQVSVVDFAGVATNAALLAAVAGDETFQAGGHHVGWLEPHLDALLDDARPPEQVLAAGALAAVLLAPEGTSPFRSGPSDLHLATARGIAHLHIRPIRSHEYKVALADLSMRCVIDDVAPGQLRLRVEGHGNAVDVVVIQSNGGGLSAWIEGATPRRTWNLAPVAPPPLPRHAQAARAGATLITAPLAGTIAEVRVREGTEVAAAELLIVLEAMKMEHRITADGGGKVQRVAVRVGDVVREGDVLVELG